MTLEEAIEHCEQKACEHSKCAEEHKQLAEWLKELQVLRRNSNTETIKERAEEYNKRYFSKNDDIFQSLAKTAYIAGATEQKAIDDELCKSGEASDGYHTFNELYDIRREYNAALVNSGVWKAHKSHRHHSGELCFGIL